MAKDAFVWEPEIVAGMTTQAITDKMKELVPGFDLSTFVARTEKYLSCEDLTEEEYYPGATFSDDDEDFIWMGCEELWKRLAPDKPPVELIARQVDDLVEEIEKAEEKQRWKEVLRLSREALDLICRHTIEETSTGRKLKREFYEELSRMTFYNFDGLFDNLIKNLLGHEDYDRVIEVAGLFGEATDDDALLEHKAESLFALGRKDEAERLYQDIAARNPDNPSYLLRAGDCYTTYGEKDTTKAKDCYLKALSIAGKRRGEPDGRSELRALYQRLMDLANDTGNRAEFDHYVRLLNSLEAKKVGRNDPCPCGSGKKYKKCCGGNVTAEPPPPVFDRRIMERDLLALRQTLEGKGFGSVEEMNKYLEKMNKEGHIPEWKPGTPLEQAQDLIFEALETVGKKRLELAEQALKISADCADAYVLQAEEKAASTEEALILYEAGVRAAERSLGKKFFEEETGNFWGIVETRPYMRARVGLAQCLWLMEKQEEAISHYRELLRLNPNDNQGIRYLLAASLLKIGQIEALQELLKQYDEPTAAWLYTRALAAFVKQGDGTEARKLIKEARDHNPYVVPYLLGEKILPGKLPQRIGFGDKNEAVVYVAEFGQGWHNTRGGIDWLALISGRKRGTGQKPLDIPEVFLKAFESEDRGHHPEKQAGNEQEG